MHYQFSASLDVTATVSQKLHAFSSQVRPNASKGVVDIQIVRVRYNFHISYPF